MRAVVSIYTQSLSLISLISGARPKDGIHGLHDNIVFLYLHTQRKPGILVFRLQLI
jgi:hypothetical protein